jgi:2-hydroxychromene-2-carboxylate isomerase
MNERVKFYWDIGSTNSYFAFHLLRPLAARYGRAIEYIPLNLGYVFRHHNYVLMEEPKAKLKNRKDDLLRWAQKYQLPFRMPDEFPIKTSRVLRGALAMRQFDLEEAYLDAVFRRYWEENDPTIQTFEGLSSSVEALGVNVQAFVEAAESETVRDALVDATNTALDDGIFGAPTVVVEDEIYWGKDRFDFVEDHLARLSD